MARITCLTYCPLHFCSKVLMSKQSGLHINFNNTTSPPRAKQDWTHSGEVCFTERLATLLHTLCQACYWEMAAFCSGHIPLLSNTTTAWAETFENAREARYPWHVKYFAHIWPVCAKYLTNRNFFNGGWQAWLDVRDSATIATCQTPRCR